MLDLRGQPQDVVWSALGLVDCRLHELKYRAAGNPLHVWAAYRICRERRLELPDFVVEYLDRSAKALLEQAADPSRGVASPAAGVTDALGLSSKGSSTMFRRWAKEDRDRFLAACVVVRIQAGWSAKQAAVEVSNDHGVSESTVERAFRGLRCEFTDSSYWEEVEDHVLQKLGPLLTRRRP